jgi:hypothetical protein
MPFTFPAFALSPFSSLPFGHVEPTLIRFDASRTIDTLGIIVAPLSVLAHHVAIHTFPSRVHRGYPFQFELVLCDDYPSQHHEARKAATQCLARHACVHIRTESESASASISYTPIVGASELDVCKVLVSIDIANSDAKTAPKRLVIDDITIAGHVFVQPHLSFPVPVDILEGMHAPLQVQLTTKRVYKTHSLIVGDGVLVVAVDDSPFMRLFAADGTPMPPLFASDVGLSRFATCAMAYVDSTNTLIIASTTPKKCKLLAVDMLSRTVQWRNKALGSCAADLAVLPNHGVVFVCSALDEKLYAHRLSDGVRVAQTRGQIRGCSYIATDPLSATVFASSCGLQFSKIIGFQWTDNAFVESFQFGVTMSCRQHTLAVVSTADIRSSFLVLESCGSLLVFSLPDRRLVHNHALHGMVVGNITADPSGNAIAMYDIRCDTVRVLPWPLPGMSV